MVKTRSNVKYKGRCGMSTTNQCFYLKYGLFNGMNLKCSVLRIAAESSSVEKFKSSSLNQSSKIQSSNWLGWKKCTEYEFLFQGYRENIPW